MWCSRTRRTRHHNVVAEDIVPGARRMGTHGVKTGGDVVVTAAVRISVTMAAGAGIAGEDAAPAHYIDEMTAICAIPTKIQPRGMNG